MIEQTIEVEVSVDRAWQVWTERVDLWWPVSHRRAGGRVALEPRLDGRLYETSAEGIHEYGRVRVWEPPERLVYDFFIGSSADAPSRVEVRFRPEGGGTRVEVRHERHRVPPELWERSNTGYRRAWSHLLPSFATTASEAP